MPNRQRMITDHVSAALLYAEEEARQFKHGWIEPDHIFLGLLRDGESIAAEILSRFDVIYTKITQEVTKSLTYGDKLSSGPLPLSDQSNKALKEAGSIAKEIGNSQIGTGELLLGLALEGGDVISGVLRKFGITSEQIKHELVFIINKTNSRAHNKHNQEKEKIVQSSNTNMETEISTDKGQMEADENTCLALARLAIEQHSTAMEQFSTTFLLHSQKRRQVYRKPFVLDSKAITELDEAICLSIKKIDFEIPIRFSALVKLKNRRVVAFSTIEELVNWNEPEKSFPVRLQMTWRYAYSPPGVSLPIPLPYDIIIDYETEPDSVDKMALGIEEEIIFDVECPSSDWVRIFTEPIDAIIETTYMPIWWRWPRIAITKSRPFVSNAMFTTLMALVWLGWVILYQNDRQVAEANHRTDVANQIFALSDLNKKFDLFVAAWSEPPTSGIEFFKGLFLYLFVGYGIAGALYWFYSITYSHLAPPSVILVGMSGKRRIILFRIYGGAWILLLGGVVSYAVAKFFG